MEPEKESLCLLLLQMLEKSLYLEFSLSQFCGIKPVLGRVEDFSKEIEGLMQGTNCFLAHPFRQSVLLF